MSSDHEELSYETGTTRVARAAFSLDRTMIVRLSATLAYSMLGVELLYCLIEVYAAGKTYSASVELVPVLLGQVVCYAVPAVFLIASRGRVRKGSNGAVIAALVGSIAATATMTLAGVAPFMSPLLKKLSGNGLPISDFSIAALVFAAVHLVFAGAAVKLVFHAVRLLASGGTAGPTRDAVIDVRRWLFVIRYLLKNDPSSVRRTIGGAAIAEGLLAFAVGIYSVATPGGAGSHQRIPVVAGSSCRPGNSFEDALDARDRKRVLAEIGRCVTLDDDQFRQADRLLQEQWSGQLKSIPPGQIVANYFSRRGDPDLVYLAPKTAMFFGSARVRVRLNGHFSSDDLSGDSQYFFELTDDGRVSTNYFVPHQSWAVALVTEAVERYSQRYGSYPTADQVATLRSTARQNPLKEGDRAKFPIGELVPAACNSIRLQTPTYTRWIAADGTVQDRPPVAPPVPPVPGVLARSWMFGVDGGLLAVIGAITAVMAFGLVTDGWGPGDNRAMRLRLLVVQSGTFLIAVTAVLLALSSLRFDEGKAVNRALSQPSNSVAVGVLLILIFYFEAVLPARLRRLLK